MDPQTPLTWGLLAALTGVSGGGIGIVVWLQRVLRTQLKEQKDELLYAINAAHSEIDKKVEDLARRLENEAINYRKQIAELYERLHRQELAVRDRSEQFLSKSTFRDVSADMRDMVKNGMDKLEGRLMRLESYLQPSAAMSSALARLQDAKGGER